MSEDSIERRRSFDNDFYEMKSDIKLILAEQKRYLNWMESHQQIDDKNFKKIDDDILVAKTTITNSKWLMGILWTGAVGLYGFIEWLKTGGHK